MVSMDLARQIVRGLPMQRHQRPRDRPESKDEKQDPGRTPRRTLREKGAQPGPESRGSEQRREGPQSKTQHEAGPRSGVTGRGRTDQRCIDEAARKPPPEHARREGLPDPVRRADAPAQWCEPPPGHQADPLDRGQTIPPARHVQAKTNDQQ